MAKRYQTNETASIEVYGRAAGATVSVVNLSATGAYLEWDRPQVDFNVGDLIRMRIDLSQVGKNHVINAEVKWVSKGKDPVQGVGVHFIKSDEVIHKLMARI